MDGGNIPADSALSGLDFLELQRHRRLWLQYVLQTPQPCPAADFAVQIKAGGGNKRINESS
jgi:hypothetical protein